MLIQRIRHAHPFTILLVTLLAAPMIAMVPAIALERSASHSKREAFVAIPIEQPDVVGSSARLTVPVARHAHATRSTPKPKQAIGRYGFEWPVTKAAITSPFGMRPFVAWPGMPKDLPHPKKQFHHGDDISCALNQPVEAARGGTVVLSGTNDDYGDVIVIQHSGGWSTLYAHMNKLLVPAGRQVARGAVIGLCGMTGHATGVHLHFEIRQSGRFFDPLKFLP